MESLSLGTWSSGQSKLNWLRAESQLGAASAATPDPTGKSFEDDPSGTTIGTWSSGQSKLNWLRVDSQLDTASASASDPPGKSFFQDDPSGTTSFETKDDGTTSFETKYDETMSVQSGERRQEAEHTFDDEVEEEGIELRDDDTIVQYAIPTPKGSNSPHRTRKKMMVPIALKKVPSTLKKAPATLRKALANITPPHTPNGSTDGSTASSAKSMTLSCTSARKQRQEMERKKIEKMIESGKLIVVKKETQAKTTNKRKASDVDAQTNGACIQQNDDGADSQDCDTPEEEVVEGKDSNVLCEVPEKASRATRLLSAISTRRVQSAPERLESTEKEGAMATGDQQGEATEDADGDVPDKTMRSTRLLRSLSMRERKVEDGAGLTDDDETEEASFIDSFMLNLMSGQEPEEKEDEEATQKSMWSKVKIRKRRKSKQVDEEDEDIWGTIDNFWTGVTESETVQCLQEGMADVFNPKESGVIDDVMEEWAIFWDDD